MSYEDSDDENAFSRSRGSEKITSAFNRKGTVDLQDFQWLIDYLNGELPGYGTPGVRLLSFWVAGQPSLDTVSGFLLARKEAVGEVVQAFTDNESLPLSVSVALPGIPNQEWVGLCFGGPGGGGSIAWPGGQPSPDALSLQNRPSTGDVTSLSTDVSTGS